MKILGIETSCDETSVAVVDGEDRILANVIHSQVMARGQFRDHTAVPGMQFHLGGDNVGPEASSVFNHRHRRFITRGFDTQNLQAHFTKLGAGAPGGYFGIICLGVYWGSLFWLMHPFRR